MSKRIIALLVFTAICVALIVYVSNKTEKKADFSLISIVPERQVIGHLNALKLIEDFEEVNRHLRWGGGFNFYLTQVKKQLLNSGLDLESTFFTHSDVLKETALYLEIKDNQQFEEFAKEMVDYYGLKQIDSISQVYSTDRKNVYLEFNNTYIVLKWAEINSERRVHSANNLFRDSLLKVKNQLYINPQGKDTICKDEFLQITYNLDSSLSFVGNWITENIHPIQQVQDSIQVYPSAKRDWVFTLNIDPIRLETYQNEWLEKNYNKWIQKLDFDRKEFRKYWNGMLSLQFGGETTIEKVTTNTVFDENFNQIEEKEITKTKVKDFGLVVGSSNPKKMLSFIKKQSNVKVKGSEIYFPFSPPLKESFFDESVLLSSAKKELSTVFTDEIISAEGKFLKFWLETHGKLANEKQFDFEIEAVKLPKEPY